MIYKIDFNDDKVEEVFTSLCNGFVWHNRFFENENITENRIQSALFLEKVNELRFLGVATCVHICQENGYDRIAFARINNHIFIGNGMMSCDALKSALKEIAHPKSFFYG